MDMKQWFKEAQYGMMINWGLYSLLAGEWRGKRGSGCSEWIQSRLRIPRTDYDQLAKAFQPIYFDADEWVKFAKEECGMKYFVVDSKHHDGFAMYHSKVDKFNVVDATPFGRDVVGELAEACYKHGLKMGLYYSQDVDWHEQHGGGYLSGTAAAGTTWCNDWDFPDNEKKNYDICFRNKIYPQVEEILRNYGELALIWFDVPMTINKEQSRKLYELVKRYQPDCLINSRLGNGAYDYVSFKDNEMPESIPKQTEIDQSGTNGFNPSPHGLYETPATMNNSWGYCAWDQDWKNAETIAANKKRLNAMGVNYLLNMGPDGLGRFPVASQEILREVAKKLV